MNDPIKNKWRIWIDFSPEKMYNKNTKWCSTPLLIRETHIKARTRHYFISISIWLKQKWCDNMHWGKDVDKFWHLLLVEYKSLWKTIQQFLQGSTLVLPYNLVIPLLSMYSWAVRTYAPYKTCTSINRGLHNDG
jgi:hypothetical protein